MIPAPLEGEQDAGGLVRFGGGADGTAGLMAASPSPLFGSLLEYRTKDSRGRARAAACGTAPTGPEPGGGCGLRAKAGARAARINACPEPDLSGRSFGGRKRWWMSSSGPF